MGFSEIRKIMQFYDFP